MKRAVGVIVFAILIVIFVGLIVFMMGNNQAPRTTGNSSVSGVNTTTLNQTLPGIEEQGVTRQELGMHNEKENCWISYGGKVYDITLFLPKHPGSADAIAPYCGTAEEFENAFSGQHGQSQVGKLMQEGIYKGDLK